MEKLHPFFMDHAIKEAWKYQGLTYPNPAVGATVVLNGLMVGCGAHQKAGSAHAEVHAICDAICHLRPEMTPFFEGVEDSTTLHELALCYGKDLFIDAVLYVTLEPCAHYGKTPPCSLLISQLGFRRVVIGALDPTKEASGGVNVLQQHGVSVTVGVMQEECETLLAPFVAWKKGSFSFFKLALTLNGVVTGGTLSCEEARTHMHKLRSVVDELIIGGNTVRCDRPTLDARLCHGKAPHVAIFSKTTDFDHTIPLFGVPLRHVRYCNSLDERKGFVMIEGGEGMMDVLADEKELWYLFYVTPKFSQEKSLSLQSRFEFLYSHSLGSDILIWARPISS